MCRPPMAIPSQISSNPALIALLHSVFPYSFDEIIPLAYPLEIVTPPSHILTGFILDPILPSSSSGRTVYIHLPPPHSSSSQPEALSANFSEVLRPHDPLRSPPAQSSSLASGLDIRESLTALLDLAGDNLEAERLVIVLDRDEREEAGLVELLHSLMYAGGAVIPPGRTEEGWEWDCSRWVMVCMEL